MIGSKGIPAAYGGFETFADRLVRECEGDFAFHVACMDDHACRKEYAGADCFHIKVPNVGPAKAVYYDLAAFRFCLTEIEKNHYEDAIVYVMACRIGPFAGGLARKLHRLGGTLFVNPDGHEWMRAKWSAPIRRYWKFSERGMVKAADLLICDSKNIECYIQETYEKYKPKTCYISYGADVSFIDEDSDQREHTKEYTKERTSEYTGESTNEYTWESTNESTKECTRELPRKGKFEDQASRLHEWLSAHHLTAGHYALIVGRFVPENNYETMIREYLSSEVEDPLVIITNIEKNSFYEKLRAETRFEEDDRIRFVGTVYDEALLSEIRRNAWVYLHGHEVGGTNPSLLEALGTTPVNLLLDVGFNREVGEDGALYWTKEKGSLKALLENTLTMSAEERKILGAKAKNRIREAYSWEKIAAEYKNIFTVK